jgi:hypothetical protein
VLDVQQLFHRRRNQQSMPVIALAHLGVPPACVPVPDVPAFFCELGKIRVVMVGAYRVLRGVNRGSDVFSRHASRSAAILTWMPSGDRDSIEFFGGGLMN